MMKILKLLITAVILSTALSLSALAMYENGEGIYSDNVYMENICGIEYLIPHCSAWKFHCPEYPYLFPHSCMYLSAHFPPAGIACG